MNVRQFTDGTIYVTFDKGAFGEHYIPLDIEEWVRDNTKPNFGYINGKRSGMFLDGEDAVAFKLKFGYNVGSP